MALTAILTACGGSGSSASGDSGPAPSDAAPQLTITSHQDGATVTGARTLAIAAIATDDKAITAVSAEWNGVPVLPASIVRNGNDITVTVALKDNANALRITVADGAGQQATKTLALHYPFLKFDNYPAANLVIGQADLDSDGEADRQKLINSPYGNPLVHQGRLYLPDYGNNRVMGYLGFPSTNGAAADFVLGQANFTNLDCAPFSGSCMNGPQTVTADGNRLLVIEPSNNRVLIFNQAPTTSGATAQLAVGQADLTSTNSGCSANRLRDPESTFVVNGKLIVADKNNHRVLIWNTVPTASGTPADLVLGQGAFDKCKQNDDNQDYVVDATPSARTMNSPTDVWSDGKRLIVADKNNHRVLIWNSFPTSHFTPADVVLGQPDFVSGDADTGADRLDNPYFLSANGNQLFVADSGNHRVLIWNTIPTNNGAAADRVIGQQDFTSRNRDRTAQGLDTPSGLALHGNRLIVADRRNDRYVAYQAAD